MSIQSIPLSDLHPSPRNVRKTRSGIDSLAALILAHGLLQNLVVERVKDRFEVVAGERRRLALNKLSKDGTLPPELQSIDCIVVPTARAGEASLVENFGREPMHPIEQFEAFKALLDTDEPEADVAARFGVTVLYLRQRMKLAKLSPKIIAAFRDGKLNLEKVEAFTVSDDHKAQEAVLKRIDNWTEADDIRETLLERDISAGDKRVKFIGLAEYEAAGGAVKRDLFDDKNAGYVADAKLLDQLVDAKLQEAAAKVRKEGWSFVDVGTRIETYQYPKLQGKAADLDKGKCGAIVTIDRSGKIETLRGVLKPGSKVTAAGTVTTTNKKGKVKKASDLSFAQVQQLQAARDQIVAEHLVQNPRIALAALAARMASRVLAMNNKPIDDLIRINPAQNYEDRRPSSIARIGTDMSDALQDQVEKLQQLVPAEGSLFQWLLNEPETRSHEILALCTAPNLDWLLLTKRIGNAERMITDAGGWSGITATSTRNPLPNVWLGATVVNQEEADRDVPKLLRVPARVRFLSIEPMLGPIDVRWAFPDIRTACCHRCGFRTNSVGGSCPNDGETLRGDIGIDWIIAGGESGADARPMHPDWVRSLRDQCASAGVAFLFKQWGEWAPYGRGQVDSKLFVNPRTEDTPLQRFGKKLSGRQLDGRLHDQYPEVA